MNIQPRAIRWLADGDGAVPPPPVVFGEGDRLANSGFFDALRGSWDLKLLWLDTPDAVAADRRAGRGSAQNEAWLRGRATKVRRLSAEQHPVRRLDGQQPADVNAAIIRQLLDT